MWYSIDSNACLARYSDADWAGSVDDRKSTSGGYFYLGNNLVSWMSKKQNFVSLSIAEAAGSCYTQLLWMKKLLHDYGIPQDTMCVFCDNTSAINLSKNPVQHSKSKHIEIRYHLFEIWWKKELCVLNSYTQTIKRQTSSPSLSMVHGLNPSVRPLVLVQSLESLVCCVLQLFILCYFACWGTHYFVGYLYSTILLIVNCFVCFCCFYFVVFYQSFPSYVSKIQKPHKK